MTNNVKIRPLRDRVAVKRIDEETISSGGIVIPDSATEKPVQGTIVAVGTDPNLSVKIGDSILFGKQSGTEAKVNGEDFLVLKEDEIIAIIKL